MVSKFLIDECLSPDMALLARERGFVESSHVTWLGKGGWKDWELKQFILDHDWVFVGPADQPGSYGQYADVPIHAGLICINGPDRMTADIEVELFGVVLDAIDMAGIVNEVIEIRLADVGAEYELVRYALPR